MVVAERYKSTLTTIVELTTESVRKFGVGSLHDKNQKDQPNPHKVL